MEGVASLIAGTYDNLRAFEHAQQSNEYMQAILESAKDLAILSTDTQGVVITSSIGSEPIFHLSSKQILGASILALFTDAQFRKELAEYIYSSDSLTLERKRLRQNRNAHKAYLDVAVQRVYDPAKLAVGFLCIVENVTENVHLQERLEALSITDELTGLYNRRRFFSAVTGELERSRRFKRRLSLCFLDLDGFKKYNDLNGHMIGDRVLKEAADLVLSSVRSGVDSCYRYGGDEFTIIMPETVQSNARLVAERIRTQLEDHFKAEITASIGIAESTPYVDVEKLLERADKAMYRAKSLGGNRTVLAD
jgi:diguanylate cyclase (GGDEF)-like protein/PAS domain S-box-containing protein